VDFGLSSERATIVEWARGLASRTGGLELVRGLRSGVDAASEAYRELGAAGLLGLGIDSGDHLDRALACEQLGAQLVWTPQLDSAVCIGELLALAGGRALLDDVLDGSAIVAAPLAQLAAPVELPAMSVEPVAEIVVRSPWLPVATHVAVAVWLPPDVREGDLAVIFLPRAAWTAQHVGAYVDFLPVHETRISVQHLLDHGIVRDGPQVGEALDLAVSRTLTALAAFTAGAGRAALELAAEYARHRVQFGRPIGAFQAQQQKLADALLRVRQAEQLVRAAAVRSEPDAQRFASAAASRLALRSFRQAAQTASFVHGGYGLSLEFDVHLYFVYAQILAGCYGDTAVRRLGEASQREAA